MVIFVISIFDVCFVSGMVIWDRFNEYLSGCSVCIFFDYYIVFQIDVCVINVVILKY